MTVTVETARISYVGDNSTVAFSVPFKFLANSHIAAYLSDLNGENGALTTAYSLAGSGVDAGGTLTMTTAPTSSQKLTILRAVPFTQSDDYIANDSFPASTAETGYDKLTMLLQMLAERVARAPRLAPASDLADVAIAAPAAGEFLRWNLAGTGIESADAVYDNGNFLQSGTGAVERTVDSKLGDFLDVRDFGVTADGSTDDSTAFAASVAAAIAAKKSLRLAGGTMKIVTAPATVTGNLSLIGHGSSLSRIYWAGTGAFMTFSDVYQMGPEADTTFTVDNGTTLRGFTVYGNRSLAVDQHGFYFEKRTDQVVIDDLHISLMRGYGIRFGHGTSPSFFRESCIKSLHIRSCGLAGSYPSMKIESTGTGDSSNQVNFYDLRIVFGYGDGLVIENSNTAKAITRLNFFGTELHGRLDGASDDLLRVIGDVTNCNFYGLKLNNAGATDYGVSIESNGTGAPAQCKFWLDHNVGANIVDAQAGSYLEFHAGEFSCTGTAITVGAAVTGQVVFNVPNDGSLVTSVDASAADKVFSFVGDNTTFPVGADRFIVDRTCSIVRVTSTPEGSVTALAGSLALKGSSGTAGDSDTVAVKVSGTGNTGWRFLQEIVAGTTANRPGTPTDNQMYVDTTLGKPVWYIGGAWVDATGAPA